MARKQKKDEAGNKKTGARGGRGGGRDDNRGSLVTSSDSSLDKLSWLSGRKVEVRIDDIKDKNEFENQINSLRLVLIQLVSDERMKYEICNKYGINPAALKTADPTTRTVRGVARERVQDPTKLRVFELHLRQLAKDRENFDPVLGTFDTDHVAAERDLYKDYLDLRTRFRRKVVVIPVPALRFILDGRDSLVPTMEEHKIQDWRAASERQYELSRIPIRVDSFHVDWQRVPIRCSSCGFPHTVCPELEQRVRPNVDSAYASLGGGGIGEHRFNTEKLLDLFTILQQPVFKSILSSAVGDESWTKIEQELKINSEMNRSRESIHALQIFMELKQLCKQENRYVYLGDHAAYTVRADALQPAALYQHLQQLSSAQQSELLLDEHKVNVIKNFVEILQKEIEIINGVNKTLKIHFEHVSSAHCAIDTFIETDAKKRTAERARNRINAKLKHFAAIKVYQGKGVVTELTYRVLIKRKILKPIEGIKPVIGVTWCMPVGVKENNQFVNALRFMFITTNSPDIIEFKLIRSSEVEDSGRRSDLLLHGEFSLRDLASRSPRCHIYKYDPTGDRVAVQKEHTIEFIPDTLLAFLQQLPRPRHNLTSAADDATAAQEQHQLYSQVQQAPNGVVSHAGGATSPDFKSPGSQLVVTSPGAGAGSPEGAGYDGRMTPSMRQSRTRPQVL